MPADVTLACVGKPSAGKSSFLNAVTDAAAKVGNYPFTTIEPNHGVTFYPTACPCKRFNKMDQCLPRYGKCVNGTRYVPVKMIDVAGLVPGASEGARADLQGLGNQFLDDLRHADALIHVVDVSGTTNAKGEATLGYDPINDIDWLRSEIHSWILNNMKRKWDGTKRRHLVTKASPIDTLQSQLSGYGANHRLILIFYEQAVQRVGGKPLEEWEHDDLSRVVDAFLDVRFPTVIACNKIDLPDSDKNIARLCKKYNEPGAPVQNTLVFTSALAESFLRKLVKSGFIRYTEGTDEIVTHDDEPEDAKTLKPLDTTTRNRLEKVKDMVLYRYGGTGTLEAVRRIVDLLGMIPVYPVKSIHNFTTDSGANRTGKVFRDCLLVRPGTTVHDLLELLPGDLTTYYSGAETVGAIQLGENDVITTENNIIAIKLSRNLDKD